MKTMVLGFLLASPLFCAPAPGVDTLKTALSKRWQELKPQGFTERNVLFQAVTPGRPDAGSYPFQVTATLRDYSPGYPKNQFYGETCVGKFEKARFTLAPDGFGDWIVQGAMTADNRACKPNPAAGVTSIPVDTLPGSPAGAATVIPSVAPIPASQGAGQVSVGRYECWAGGTPQLGLRFSIQSGTTYTGADGKPGTFHYDSNTGRMTFSGGALDGAMPPGFFAVYHSPNGTPSLSFRNSGGREASHCELAR